MKRLSRLPIWALLRHKGKKRVRWNAPDQSTQSETHRRVRCRKVAWKRDRSRLVVNHARPRAGGRGIGVEHEPGGTQASDVRLKRAGQSCVVESDAHEPPEVVALLLLDRVLGRREKRGLAVPPALARWSGLCVQCDGDRKPGRRKGRVSLQRESRRSTLGGAPGARREDCPALDPASR